MPHLARAFEKQSATNTKPQNIASRCSVHSTVLPLLSSLGRRHLSVVHAILPTFSALGLWLLT